MLVLMEADIVGKSHAESAVIRVEEATCASQMLGARPVFMTQIDGNTEINKEHYVEMCELIAARSPMWFSPIGPSTRMPTIGCVRCWCMMRGAAWAITSSYIISR